MEEPMKCIPFLVTSAVWYIGPSKTNPKYVSVTYIIQEQCVLF